MSAANPAPATPAVPGVRALPEILQGRLSLPAVAAPLFILSGPELVIAQCKAGVVGSFPALNARPETELTNWLTRIETELEQAQRDDPQAKIAPHAVNLICHPSNERLDHDIGVCVEHRVPIVITSLSAPERVIPHVHEYGGLVFHDVISTRHARKAIAAGVDGLILVCAGAGGHAGTLNPFAFVAEVRQFFDGPILLSGAITHGRQVLAARSLGADMAYIGSYFITAQEANAAPAYQQMVVESSASDIVYTNLFSGVHANYLSESIRSAGLDPAALPDGDKSRLKVAEHGTKQVKAWRDVWSAGHGVGSIVERAPASALIERLIEQYRQAARETAIE